MTYDMQLGLLATEAITNLVTAAGSDDQVQQYRAFLNTSAEYCRRARATEMAAEFAPVGEPKEVSAFISAVMKVSEPKSSEYDRDRLRMIHEIEPLIELILQQNRTPSSEEQIAIAEVLYSTSGADFRE